MSSPIRIIAAREIRDTLSDWRLLTPILIMTLVFPTVIVAGANIFISFVEDRNVIRTIIPFAMLLIGFIPASFSLITALESFVGERERNSLEALLSMPISDNQLYISKLISALLPPLGSALLAMGVFAVQLSIREPELFATGLKPEHMLTVALLIGVKAVLMVAGAVIISSHTSSIRASNLLASFVLLPTAALIQIEALYIIAGLWGQLRIFALVLVIFTAVLVRTGMGAFNREEILSREHEQLNLGRIWATFRTYLRSYQRVNVVADQYPITTFSISRFYRHELPALLRDYRLPLAVACIAALSGVIGGTWVGLNIHVPWLDHFLQRQIGATADSGLAFALGTFLNNLRVSLVAGLLSTFTFGLFSFLVPAAAFGQVALVTAFLAARGGGAVGNPSSPLGFLLAYVLPHGIIELPTAILGAAMGLRLGAALMSSERGVTVGQNMLWSLAQFFKVWALVLVPLYAVAALIEGVITPLIVRAVY